MRLLDRIVPAVAPVAQLGDTDAHLSHAVVANVQWQVEVLKRNPVVAEKKPAANTVRPAAVKTPAKTAKHSH